MTDSELGLRSSPFSLRVILGPSEPTPAFAVLSHAPLLKHLVELAFPTGRAAEKLDAAAVLDLPGQLVAAGRSGAVD